MASNTLTVKLPPEVFTRLRDRARRSKRSVEAEVVNLLTDAVGDSEVLPPDIEEAIAAVARLDDRALRKAVKPIMTLKQSKRLEALNRKAQDEGLSDAEQGERDDLLHIYEKSMVVRATVLAELHKRGMDVSEMVNP